MPACVFVDVCRTVLQVITRNRVSLLKGHVLSVTTVDKACEMGVCEAVFDEL